MALLLCRTDPQETTGGTNPTGSVIHVRFEDWTHTAHETQLYYFFQIDDDPSHEVAQLVPNPAYGEESPREEAQILAMVSAPELTWAHLMDKRRDGTARWVVNVDAVAARIFGTGPNPLRVDYDRKHAAARERRDAKALLSRRYREWFASSPPGREQADMFFVRKAVEGKRNYLGTNGRTTEFNRGSFTDTRELRAIKAQLRVLDDRDFEAQQLDTGTPIEIFEHELIDRGTG